jgi:hypothetical protein
MRSRKLALVAVMALAFSIVVGSMAMAGEKLEPLKLELPLPMFKGTPKNIKLTPYIRKPTGKPRPAFMVPEGTKLLSFEKPVTSSDDEPIVGELEMVTDGDKKGSDGSYVELGPNRQWVQIDLEEPHTIYAIVLWHYHGEARIYHDVVVQLADDADFITNVRTVFNNDYDNSSGLGIGKDLEYFEMYEGELIPVKGLKARYLRLYSKGSTASDLNHYTEVEVWGK